MTVNAPVTVRVPSFYGLVARVTGCGKRKGIEEEGTEGKGEEETRD